jgi:hypothetical protein
MPSATPGGVVRIVQADGDEMPDIADARSEHERDEVGGAVQMTKQIVTTLKMAPIFEAVVIPMVAQQIKDGVFTPNALQTQAAGELLTELRRWAAALACLREVPT